MDMGEWRPRYELVLSEVPKDVQAFLPVREADFRILPITYITSALAQRIQQIDIQRWAVEKEGEVVGTITLIVHKKSKVHNELVLHFNPAHRQILAEPLLTLALETLKAYPKNILQTEIRSSGDDLLELLKKYGFVEILANHRLGAKFN
jgi:hypothetical protein